MPKMSQWKYKIIGALIGVLTRRPQFILLGLAIGHLFDIGFFSKKPASAVDAPKDATAPNPYAVLEVPEDAGMDDIEQAYRRKISDYHPDKVSNAAPELKALAERRAREINAAYDELKKLRQKP
jgi:preprotein translocase subunit Sec63